MPVMRFEASIIPLRVPLALKLERLSFKTTRERLIERVLNDRQTIETRAQGLSSAIADSGSSQVLSWAHSRKSQFLQDNSRQITVFSKTSYKTEALGSHFLAGGRLDLSWNHTSHPTLVLLDPACFRANTLSFAADLSF